MNSSNSKITGEIKISPSALKKLQKKAINIPSFKGIIEAYLGKRATDLAEILLGGGVLLEASDIHIEPEEERAKLRLRIDGILQDVLFFDWKIYETLLSRANFLAGLKLNIADRPQD